MIRFEQFKEVWTVDFEFVQGDGENPLPVCCVGHELRSGRVVRIWEDQLTNHPFADFRESLLIAFFATAEVSCFLALGWPLPRWVLDLFAEFRNLTNGLPTLAGNSLIGALTHFGLDAMSAQEKKTMQERIKRGGPWTPREREEILDYCQEDVDALDRLLPAILPAIDLPRALYRGWFMSAVAVVESHGIPINNWWLRRLNQNWDLLKSRLITEIDRDYGVFKNGSFRANRFVDYLERNNIPWPLLPRGKPELTDEVFREMSRSVPAIAPLRELRHMLSDLRLNKLAIGKDNRHRYRVGPFRARTGRNGASSNQYIFGPSVWIRSLIQPARGCSLAVLDYEQQEFGIAAVLSGDQKMLEAYASGDPYLAFGKQAKIIPPEGTKNTHRALRDLLKTVVLGTNYGMEAGSLAHRIGRPEIEARQFLQSYREVYRTFWKWSENVQDHAMLNGWQQTVFGWTKGLPWDEETNPRSLKNFPAQANGAEILRLAACLAIERQIRLIALIHDAVLIEAPNDRIRDDVRAMTEAMEDASRIVLGGFVLRVESKIIRHPNHYRDPRGDRMWDRVRNILRTPTATTTPDETNNPNKFRRRYF
jgi:DNA polymerase-1